MSVYYDENTGFEIGCTDYSPFTSKLPSQALLINEYNSMILSASGWRKIFTLEGKEEDTCAAIGPENGALTVFIAQSFSQYIKATLCQNNPVIVVGIDTRPTGQEIAQIIIRILVYNGIQVRYVFISAAPEIMAYARSCDGFVYISASHNPVGHNGIKFGFNDGGVIPGSEASKLSSAFSSLCLQKDSALKAVSLYNNAMKTDISSVYENAVKYKQEALVYYENFTKKVISREEQSDAQQDFLTRIKYSLLNNKLTILADMNGSARTVSIDKDFLTSIGCGFLSFNNQPREIVHAIIPEPENLVHCAKKMEELQAQGNNTVLLGYMPDCDGDRGNIVYWDSKGHKAEVLKAQEVFALSVLSELSYTAYIHNAQTAEELQNLKTAVSVNDPTSMRIEEIAGAFFAAVHRAEVGEANVVNLARSLREQGFDVPILGEGSNGGNITHPAAVRDPLNTLSALIKLLTIKDDPAAGKKGLYHIWLNASGREDEYSDHFTLSDILNSLPQYTTTGVSEQRALLRITTKNHEILKSSYQKVITEQWSLKKDELREKFGIVSWRAVSNNGIYQTDTITDFAISKNGGLKIIFSDESNIDIAFIWMRGSGTEPVFRVMCDVKGCSALSVKMEKELLSWHRDMIQSCDVA